MTSRYRFAVFGACPFVRTCADRKSGQVRRRDLLDVARRNRVQPLPSVRRQPQFAEHPCAARVQLQRRAALAEALPKIREVAHTRALGAMRPHVLDERGDQLPDRGPSRERAVLAAALRRIEPPQLLLGDLDRVRLQAPPPLVLTRVPLYKPDRTPLLRLATLGLPCFLGKPTSQRFRAQGTAQGSSTPGAAGRGKGGAHRLPRNTSTARCGLANGCRQARPTSRRRPPAIVIGNINRQAATPACLWRCLHRFQSTKWSCRVATGLADGVVRTARASHPA